ncbi:MAG: sugar kinase [Planctomycetales bacterium]|nr:sugar kinase [Planctomycetales bacterium]
MSVVTFGEIMGRLAPPGFLRLGQAMPGTLEVTFAGAEANVAASLATFGMPTEFVTALPDNTIADACVATLRARGVGTKYIVRRAGRLGLYFLETGANQRPSQVVYDREASAISKAEPDEFPWSEIFSQATWFHFTGITPAVSANAFHTVSSAIQAARQANVPISCDLNFRKKLWNWQAGTTAQRLAQECMRHLLPHVDVVIANEEDCHDVLGIQAAGTDVEAGELSTENYPDVARQLIAQFPNVRQVAITLRESLSASHNNWGAMLHDATLDQSYFAPRSGDRYKPYEIRNLVDRVGGGDAFAAGLIFAKLTPELAAPDMAVAYAVAASCLAQSIVGDFNFSSRAEVESLMGGSQSGRVIR